MSSAEQLRKLTDRCLMGGLDETRIQERTLPSLARDACDADCDLVNDFTMRGASHSLGLPDRDRTPGWRLPELP